MTILETAFKFSLIALTLAQNSTYSAICPTLAKSQPDEISPGYFVEYKCDTLGPRDGSPFLATTAKECAVSCQNAGAGCLGSSWLSTLNLCYLSGPSAEIPFPGAVYMKRVNAPAQACQQQVGSLQDQLQKLQLDLQTCQAGTSQAGSSINSTTFCQNEPFPVYTPPVILEGNKRYHVWCRYRSVNGKDDAIIQSVPNFLDCIRECNSRTNFVCTQAIWSTSKVCYLRKSGEELPPVYNTANKDWVTAQLKKS